MNNLNQVLESLLGSESRFRKRKTKVEQKRTKVFRFLDKKCSRCLILFRNKLYIYLIFKTYLCKRQKVASQNMLERIFGKYPSKN